MGVDLTALLDGVRQTQAMNDPYSAENMAKQIGSFDYGIDESGALPQMPDTDQGEDIAVKAFKPKKRSFLGLLGDAILLNQGHKGPFFADRIKRKNYERAFEGMTNDPMETVRRISTFDPETAWKMYGQLRDDERADKARDQIADKNNDVVLKNAAGIMGVALRNPQNRQAAIARYNQVLRSRGLEDHILADDVDDATLESIYYGAMPPSQQEQAEYRKIRAEQMERGLDIREKGTDSLIERRNVQNRNDTTKVGQAQERINISRQKGKNTNNFAGRAYKDPNGSLIEFNKDGNNIKVTSPSGNMIGLYKRGLDGKPVLIKRMTKKEYEAAIAEK